jgi:hypothetical protein
MTDSTRETEREQFEKAREDFAERWVDVDKRSIVRAGFMAGWQAGRSALAERESAWQAEREQLRGALAAAKIALYTFTNTPATSDSEKRMVFRLDPNDFLQIRQLEEFVDKTLASGPQLIPEKEKK